MRRGGNEWIEGRESHRGMEGAASKEFFTNNLIAGQADKQCGDTDFEPKARSWMVSKTDLLGPPRGANGGGGGGGEPSGPS